MASVPLEDKNDYLKFVLPDFKHWESVISKGTPISGKTRRYIVSQLFQECFRITWYPSQRLYRRSVDLLLEKYPHLRDCTDENGQAWIEQLSNKFRNMRRKASTAAVKIQEMRDKFGTKRPNTQAQQRNKKLCRLHNQEHLIVYGETEESLAKHQQWLATTSSTSVDPAHYRERLLATAKERHETLMTMTLTEALSMFPFLASETALLMEFEVLWKRDLKKLLEVGLNTVCTIIMRFGKEEELISLSETFSGDGVLAGLQCIASRCSEKLQMVTEGSPSLAPCLVQTTDEINLYVDGQCLFKVSSILTGVCCIFAAFWVFNIRYPKESRNTLTFLEHALFGLSETKPATKCRDLLNFYMFYEKNV
uniref:Uncharacterized protein n=1 Tax=Ixodes ricinus TaxID=34613 RepID=A0A147BDI2_IXORI